LAQALIELHDNWGEYVEECEFDVTWELKE
jgi:hypothetical protein